MGAGRADRMLLTADGRAARVVSAVCWQVCRRTLLDRFSRMSLQEKRMDVAKALTRPIPTDYNNGVNEYAALRGPIRTVVPWL